MESTQQKFLIVKLSSMGDVIHTLPVLRTLRKNFPRAHIAWVVEEKSQAILYRNPDLDEVIVLRTRHWRRHWDRRSFVELREAVRQLRRRKFDVVLDLQGLIKSGVVCLLTGAPLRLGFHSRDCREFPNAWLTNRHAPKLEPGRHVIDKNLSLLTLLGKLPVVKEYPLTLPEPAEAYIDAHMKSEPDLASQSIVGINPGTGFKSKRWKLDRFARLGDRIAEEFGGHILLTWGPGEEKLIEEISAQMKQRHWVAPPTDIHQSAALLRRLSLFISCDTGPMHLCCALGIPTVSIFGPTDPVRNGPFGPHHRVVCKPRPCSFCFKRKCPPPYNNECMDTITVEDVLTKVREMIPRHVNLPAS